MSLWATTTAQVGQGGWAKEVGIPQNQKKPGFGVKKEEGKKNKNMGKKNRLSTRLRLRRGGIPPPTKPTQQKKKNHPPKVAGNQYQKKPRKGRGTDKLPKCRTPETQEKGKPIPEA